MMHKFSCGFAFLLRSAVVLAILLNPLTAFAANDPLAREEARDPSTPLATSYGVEFVHIANASNIALGLTFLDHPLLNSKPTAIFMVTPNWNPGGVGGTYDNHPIGVGYSGGSWYIFNQDGVAITADQAFNVLVPTAGSGVFVHTATAGNNGCTFGQCTIIDNALSNNNPNAILFVTPNYDPGGVCGCVSNNHNVGVFYNGTKWNIFNQDVAAMPVNAAFNVIILDASSYVFVHTAIAANISAHATRIDNSLTNNTPNAILFVTPNWNTGVYVNHALGVYYSGGGISKWSIFDQDLAAMPVNASFNVLVAPTNIAVFIHTATAGNIFCGSSNCTSIDNSLTNNNPNAILFVTPNWKAGVYVDHPIGVFYSGGGTQKWAIFNQDLAAMPVNASFNVLVFTTDTAEFVHKATAANTSGHYTEIYYPLTNNQPNAIVFATPNWNPGAVGGTYNNHPIGMWYPGAPTRWRVFNQDLAAMPINAAFNVFVPPTSSAVFVHTATAGNISCTFSQCTVIDNPQTNNNPSALLFVTPNYDPGGVCGCVYDNHNIGVYYNGTKWAIFNQDLAAMPVNAAFNVFVTGNRLLLPLIMK